MLLLFLLLVHFSLSDAAQVKIYVDEMCMLIFYDSIEEYIISLTPPRPQSQTHRVLAYRGLAHEPWSSLAYGT